MEFCAAGTRRLRWQRAMAGFVLFGLFFRIVMQVYPPLEAVYQYILSLPYVAFAALVVYDTPMCRQTGFRLMLLCLCYAVLTSFFHRYDFNGITKLLPYFLMMLFSFCLCYPLPFLLPEQKASNALTAIFASFVFGITVLSAFGCYTAIARVMIENPARGEYEPCGVVYGRLSPFAYPTVAAVFCGLALLLLVYLFLRYRNVFSRALCVLSGLLIYVAMALTGGRIATVFLCVCFGAAGYLIAADKLAIGKKLLRVVAALGIACAVAAVSYLGSGLSVRAVNALADQVGEKQLSVAAAALPAPQEQPVAVHTAALRPEANAQPEPEPDGEDPFSDTDKYATETKDRSIFENISTLQGRTYAWEGAIRAMLADPMLLLFGSSPVHVMERVDPYIPPNTEAEGFFHLHSVYFQTLVSFGVLGFLLFAVLIGYILYHALRLFFLGKGVCSLSERTLPLLLVFCLGVDLLEIFLTFSDVTKMSNPLFFLTAGYVVYLSETRIPKKAGRKAHGTAPAEG